jgi:UDP-N-acetylglucosamine acyltransferase
VSNKADGPAASAFLAQSVIGGGSVKKPTRSRLFFPLNKTSFGPKIHPTAVVDPLARIASDVEIGPHCVVEGDVLIDSGCKLESRVVVKNGTTLGANNHIFEGAVLGGLPQHINIPENPGRVVVGCGNTIRENVTIHRALDEDEATIVGNGCLLMVNSHVAHDCRLGDNVIAVNNVMLAGHVTLGDRAYVSGAVAVHQYCRIGTSAMVGGQAHIVKDVPPFVTVDGLSSLVVGLNQIGLRRAGYSFEDICLLKKAYRVIYRSRLSWNDILARLRFEFADGLAARFYEFLSTTTRGIVNERRLPPGATLKLRNETSGPADETEEILHLRAKAG